MLSVSGRIAASADLACLSGNLNLQIRLSQKDEFLVYEENNRGAGWCSGPLGVPF